MDQINEWIGNLPDWAEDPFRAAIILIIGYFVAKIASAIVAGAINKTGLGQKAKTTGGNIGRSISKAVFWIILLLVILMALSQFDELAKDDGPLSSINDMMTGILGYGRHLIGAILLIAIGTVVAKVGKEATTSTLEAAQADTFAKKYGLIGEESKTSLPRALGAVVGAFLLILFLASAVKVLGIAPISEMLDTILDFIPKFVIFAIILGLAVLIGRFVKNLIEEALPGLGIDESIKHITSLDGESSNAVVPSKIVGTIAFAAIVLIGAVEATNKLGVQKWSDMAYTILEIVGQVSFGAVIIAVGVFIANFLGNIISQTSGTIAGRVIKYVTIILVTFIGLDQMNLADEIVQTAFSYSLAAAAVAAGIGGAIAFGLGGREWASKKLQQWWPNSTSRKK